MAQPGVQKTAGTLEDVLALCHAFLLDGLAPSSEVDGPQVPSLESTSAQARPSLLVMNVAGESLLWTGVQGHCSVPGAFTFHEHLQIRAKRRASRNGFTSCRHYLLDFACSSLASSTCETSGPLSTGNQGQVCVCVYMCRHMQIYVCVHDCTCVCLHGHVCVYVCACTGVVWQTLWMLSNLRVIYFL